MREKVGKSRNTVFFQWFGAPGGPKVGSLKRRVRSQLARWEMWREAHFQVKMYKTRQRRTTFESCDVEKVHAVAHFQVKMYKTHHVRTTFGSCDVEKVHTVVARSTFPSQNAHHVRTTFGSCDVEKVHAVVARSTFRSQNVQTTPWPFLEVQMSYRVAGARDCGPCQKWPKREGLVAFPKMMAGMGHLKRICKDAFSWQAQYKRHVHERC